MPVRSTTIFPLYTQIIHVYNRCVRRCFLCGKDKLSRKDYSHRKKIMRQRMEYLTSIFAFDIATFSIMSNHFHYVLRSRPDIVKSWSDEEVVTRNMKLQGKVWFNPETGQPRKSAAAEIERVLAEDGEVARIRKKLSDVSSLMSYFDEHLAKKFNKEDQVKGAFWEGTFGSQVIDSESALLACMAYVDLNPIRAMMAQTLSESQHTGAFERIAALRCALATGELEQAAIGNGYGGIDIASTLEWERANQPTIGWLAPIELTPSGDLLDADPIGRRPSRKGFLPISLVQYLSVVDWAGRSCRADKKGVTPESAPSILQQLGLDGKTFMEEMMGFAKLESYFSSTEREGRPDRNFDTADSEAASVVVS